MIYKILIDSSISILWKPVYFTWHVPTVHCYVIITAINAAADAADFSWYSLKPFVRLWLAGFFLSLTSFMAMKHDFNLLGLTPLVWRRDPHLIILGRPEQDGNTTMVHPHDLYLICYVRVGWLVLSSKMRGYLSFSFQLNHARFYILQRDKTRDVERNIKRERFSPMGVKGRLVKSTREA